MLVEFAPGVVGSIQRVAPAFVDTTSKTNVTTINQVDPRSLLLWNGQSTGETVTVPDIFNSATLSSTAVSWTRAGSTAATFNPDATIVEFVSGIVSVQRGAVTVDSATSTSTAITPVTAASAVVNWGNHRSTCGGWDAMSPALVLGPSSVKASKGSGTACVTTVAFEVAEFAVHSPSPGVRRLGERAHPQSSPAVGHALPPSNP